MKQYPNNNRRINKMCNEYIEMINKDYERIRSEERNDNLPHIIGSIGDRIADVHDLYLVKAADWEDKYPDIYEDNRCLLISASIGKLRYPIKKYVGEDKTMKKADDARQSLTLAIKKLEEDASKQLAAIYQDWKEEIASFEPALTE